MKFYLSMGLVVVADLLVFYIITRFYMPSYGTRAFLIMKYVFFVPIIIVSLMQVIKIYVNARHGYVVAMFFLRVTKWEFSKNPCISLTCLFSEFIIWGGCAVVICKFLITS